MATDQNTLNFIIRMQVDTKKAIDNFGKDLGNLGKQADAATADIKVLSAQLDKLQGMQIKPVASGAVSSISKTLQKDAADAQAAMGSLSRSQQALMGRVERLSITAGKKPFEALKAQIENAGLNDIASPLIQKIQKQLSEVNEHSGGGHSSGGHGASRETLVLFHELLSGRYKNAMSSFTILLGQIGAMGVILTPVGLSLTAVAGGLAAVGIAALEGQERIAEFNRATMLTNGYLGMTFDQMKALANSIGKDVPGGAIKAQDALIDLQATGKFTAENIGDIGQAALKMSQLTGESLEKTTAFFAQGMGNTDKWAQNLEDKYHALSLADMEHIQQLAADGQQQQAVVLASERLYDQLSQTAPDRLGYVIRAWQSVTGAIQNAWAAMEQWGQAGTPASQLAGLQAKLAHDQQMAASAPQYGRYAYNRNSYAQAAASDQQQIAALQKQIDDQNQATAAHAKQVQTQQSGINAAARLSGNAFDKGIGSDTAAEAIRQAVSQHKADIQAMLAANPQDTQALAYQANLKTWIAKTTKQINDEYNPPKVSNPAGAKLQNAYTSETQSLGDSLAKTQQQIQEMQQYGHIVDDSRLAVVQLEIAQGKLKGLNPKEIADIQTVAKQADAATAKLKNMQAVRQQHDQFQSQFNGRDGTSGMEAETRQLMLQYQYQGMSTAEMERQIELMKIHQALMSKTISQTEADKDAADVNANFRARQLANGTGSPYSDYVRKGGLTSDAWQNTLTNGLDKSNSLIVSMVEGTQNFNQGIKEVARSVENDLLGALTRTFTNNIVAGVFGSGQGTNGSQGLLGGWFSGVGSLLSFSEGNQVGSAAPKTVMSTAQLGQHQGALSGGSSFLTGALGLGKDLLGWAGSFFADGGIMTPYGPLPLRKYANGGVASSPQVAIYGEGKSNEAYVPLPDGRSIPVTMRGGSGGGATVNSSTVQHNNTVHVTVNNGSNQNSQDHQQNQQMGTLVANAVRSEMTKMMVEQQRVGGVLNSKLG